MTDFFGYVAAADIAAQRDTVRVLRTAATRAALVADPSYDPDHVSPWSKSAIVQVEQPPVDITNQKTAQPEPACVCQMET